MESRFRQYRLSEWGSIPDNFHSGTSIDLREKLIDRSRARSEAVIFR